MEKPQKKYRVAIVGSREYTDRIAVFQWLDKNKDKIEMIVSGGCKQGPDEFAREFCEKKGISLITHYARWRGEDGSTDKGAGFRRNELVAKDCDILVAWRVNMSKGTTDVIERAKRLGKKVHVYDFVK